jgi:hypothetical protein
MNNINDNNQDDYTSNNNNIESISNTTKIETQIKSNSNVNNIPHSINETENETIEVKKEEKLIKEKGPDMSNKKIIIESSLKVPINTNGNFLFGTSSQSSLSLSTSALPVDILDEFNSDTSEFPSDFKQTTDMLIHLKERILDSSKKILSPSIESSNKSINLKQSSIYY